MVRSFHSGKYPLGCSACADSPGFLVLGSAPAPTLVLGASDCFPGLAFFCFTGPWTLLPTAPPPPVQKRDAQHSFLQHKGARTDFWRSPQSNPESDSKVTFRPFLSHFSRPFLSHFWVTLVTLESLSGLLWDDLQKPLLSHCFVTLIVLGVWGVLWGQEGHKANQAPSKVCCCTPGAAHAGFKFAVLALLRGVSLRSAAAATTAFRNAACPAGCTTAPAKTVSANFPHPHPTEQLDCPPLPDLRTPRAPPQVRAILTCVCVCVNSLYLNRETKKNPRFSQF